MVKWLLDEDHLVTSASGRALPMASDVEARLGAILACDPNE